MRRVVALALLWSLTIVSFVPLLVALVGGATAAWSGCAIDEGSPHPCRLGGWDMGDDLQAAVVAGGWLSLVTAPGMLLAAILWTWVLWRRRRRPR